VKLYAAGEMVDWPASDDGDYARRYLGPLLARGPEAYIANAHTRLWVLRAGPLALPVSAGDFHPENSYVCSPYAHYVSYALQEFRELKNPPLEAPLRLLFRGLGVYLRRSALDRVVYVNNWLLSTNLYPAGAAEQAPAIAQALAAEFPDRAVVFRSVDACGNPELLAALRAAGGRPVFSRSVYYQDVGSAYVQRKRQFREDLKRFQRTPYQVLDGAELSAADAPRLLELYSGLYLNKYSRFNPIFTLDFIRLALAEKLLHVKALARNDRIDAVLGYVARRGLITAPLFGYDTTLPKESGLYRQLSTLISLEAQARGDVLHLSAGVGPFKRLRGGLPAIEYNAVFDAHLPAWRRRPWALMQAVADQLAIPVIQKYGF
jgi:hypothetical protein